MESFGIAGTIESPAYVVYPSSTHLSPALNTPTPLPPFAPHSSAPTNHRSRLHTPHVIRLITPPWYQPMIRPSKPTHFVSPTSPCTWIGQREFTYAACCILWFLSGVLALRLILVLRMR
ncbi:hypothetical protein BDQ17DRAFT_1371296 [Cyathus striatus]|nr:hypothetical protein BDQ17DRAFT_1371296 [Cyathus striatus]